MAFPSGTPSYQGFTSGDTLKTDNHAAQHNQEQADIIALANKVGTGSSTPTNGKVLAANGAGTSLWKTLASADISDISSVIFSSVYPVGCIYNETTGINPATTFGFGTWVAFGQGRVLVGAGTSDQAFTAGVTGGESNHVLSQTEMPSHTHTINDSGHTHSILREVNDGALGGANITSGNGSGSTSSSTGTNSATTGITNQNTGGGTSHNNLQPYIVVYFWQRTA